MKIGSFLTTEITGDLYGAHNFDIANQKIRYEVHCFHCFRRPSELDSGTPLKNCDSCQLASFCSDCPQRHSASECQTLQQLVEDEKWTVLHNEQTKAANQPALTIVCTQTPREHYLPLSAAGSWLEYYTRISDKDLRSLQITSDLRPGSDDPAEIPAVGYLRYGTRATTIPLTILAALERVLPDIGTRTSIKLHVIGASQWEIERLMVFEELLHLLPFLKSLQLTFVGLGFPEGVPAGKTIVLDCCPMCSSQGRTRSVLFSPVAYHALAQTKEYDQPDLAVAFHTGFSQEGGEQWMPTIQYLASAPHPTLFTTYNKEEMREETAMLNILGANFVQTGQLNKWMSMCPILDPMGSVEDNVYYFNQYWYIVAPRVHKMHQIV
jgi:splicing suppressor protein 51